MNLNSAFQHCYRRFVTLIAGRECSVSNWPRGRLLGSLEIDLRFFSLINSTVMLIDRSGAFTASEADVFQTGGDV